MCKYLSAVSKAFENYRSDRQTDTTKIIYHAALRVFSNTLGGFECVIQLDHLKKESERLADEKPEEAAAVDEKIVTLTALWHELKETV